MAKYTVNSCGYPLVFDGPDTVEDYDKAAGEIGSCLDDAVNNEIYRGTLPVWQAAFIEKAAATYSFPRGVDAAATTKAKDNAKEGKVVSDVPERFKAYNIRLRGFLTEGLAEADADAKLKELDALATEVAATVKVDPSPSSHATAVNKGDLAKADEILSRSNDNVEAAITKMLDAVPNYELARDPDTNLPEKASLAKLIGLFVSSMLAV